MLRHRVADMWAFVQLLPKKTREECQVWSTLDSRGFSWTPVKRTWALLVWANKDNKPACAPSVHVPLSALLLLECSVVCSDSVGVQGRLQRGSCDADRCECAHMV